MAGVSPLWATKYQDYSSVLVSAGHPDTKSGNSSLGCESDFYGGRRMGVGDNDHRLSRLQFPLL